jgi:hypothetical protein
LRVLMTVEKPDAGPEGIVAASPAVGCLSGARGWSVADRARLAPARLPRLPVLTTDRTRRSFHVSVGNEVVR